MYVIKVHGEPCETGREAVEQSLVKLAPLLCSGASISINKTDINTDGFGYKIAELLVSVCPMISGKGSRHNDYEMKKEIDSIEHIKILDHDERKRLSKKYGNYSNMNIAVHGHLTSQPWFSVDPEEAMHLQEELLSDFSKAGYKGRYMILPNQPLPHIVWESYEES